MKFLKSVLCSILIISILLPVITIFSVAEANDNNNFEGASDWALEELNEAESLGLVTSKVKKNTSLPITREEFCELAVLFYEKYTGKPAELPQS
ncbi:MAG: hypothetical protein VB118_11370, partial [Oscillospiraceae bacterium]|nr:hypothetical protein [Oscillospiraceae bacterium]